MYLCARLSTGSASPASSGAETDEFSDDEVPPPPPSSPLPDIDLEALQQHKHRSRARSKLGREQTPPPDEEERKDRKEKRKEKGEHTEQEMDWGRDVGDDEPSRTPPPPPENGVDKSKKTRHRRRAHQTSATQEGEGLTMAVSSDEGSTAPADDAMLERRYVPYIPARVHGEKAREREVALREMQLRYTSVHLLEAEG